MPFLGIGTSDTDMSVFAVLIGRNEKAKMSFILKNGKKRPDIVVSGCFYTNFQYSTVNFEYKMLGLSKKTDTPMTEFQTYKDGILLISTWEPSAQGLSGSM